jgi:hypothetical protein
VSIYIRFILTDDLAVTLADVESALQQINPTYALDGEIIRVGETEYALINITQRGDPICDDDLDLLVRFAQTKKHRDDILTVLRSARSMVCVQPLNSLDSKTVDVLAPLWDWLLANRAGMLVWEGAHFFNRAGKLD